MQVGHGGRMLLAVCEDDSVLGAPFYVTEEIVGAVITEVPPAIDTPEERRRLGFELVDGLADLHAVDHEACGLGRLGKPTGYVRCAAGPACGTSTPRATSRTASRSASC